MIKSMKKVLRSRTEMCWKIKIAKAHQYPLDLQLAFANYEIAFNIVEMCEL